MAAFHCRSAVALHDRLMSVSFTPQPQTLSAAIADRLRQEVLQGQWSPGETINDGMLAARYGVQRAPVREAMQQLSQEGLLCACTPHGMTLASPSADCGGPGTAGTAAALSEPAPGCRRWAGAAHADDGQPAHAAGCTACLARLPRTLSVLSACIFSAKFRFS